MPHTVVLTLPEYGHMNAALVLAEELAQGGEQVTVYGTEPFRAAIAAAGASYREYGPAAAFAPPPHAGGLYSVMAFLAGLTETLLPRLVEELRSPRPDYLLLDSMCLWGNLAQQVLRVPAAMLGAVFVSHDQHHTPDEFVRQVYADAPTPVLVAAIDGLNTYLMQSQRLERAFGVRCPNIVRFFGQRQARNLLFTSRRFHPAGERYDDSFAFVGPMIPAHAPALEAPLPPGNAPLIYISLGTIFNRAPEFFRACFEALGEAPCRVLVSTGGGVEAAGLGPAPANFTIRAFVPQLAVLGQAAVCVTHAGMNTTSEALWQGVPLLCLPQHGDQWLVAERVAALGAGLTLPPPARGAADLRRGVERLLHEPGFRQQAQRLSGEFRAEGGAARAAALVRRWRAEA